MPLRTKRWNDEADSDDGLRVLVCRFRPRGLPKSAETWDEWWSELAPSRELLADFHGKHGAPIDFDREYKPRYFREMEGQVFRIRALAGRVAAGETVTLLCSSACTDPARCHRTLLASLVEKVLAPKPGRKR